MGLALLVKAIVRQRLSPCTRMLFTFSWCVNAYLSQPLESHRLVLLALSFQGL